MATLEVHDGRGRVEVVRIGREAPTVFGSDPKCDIVLGDPAALPFHGRIRFQRGRFKVEAFPDAKALEVSGKKVVATVFRQGDEVRVGLARIFMMNPGDGQPDDDKTAIQPRPPAAVVPPPPVPAGRTSEVAPDPLRRTDWRALEVAPPSAEIETTEEPKRRRRRGISTSTMRTGMAPEAPPDAQPRRPAWKRWLRALRPASTAPGEEPIASSPLILGLFLALVVLVLTAVGLWGVIARNKADHEFRTAEDNLQDGEFRNSIKGFERFLADFPKDPRAGKARVLRALAGVRLYADDAGPLWPNALEAARAMVREVGKEPAYRDAKADLAALVLKTAAGLADRARKGADAESLRLAEAARSFHEQLAGPAAATLRDRAQLPGKIDAARAAVEKARVRKDALARMDGAIRSGAPPDVFAAFDALTARYPDLANDREVVARMTKANDLLRRAVAFSPTTRPAETTPRAEALGPPTSLVLRADPKSPGSADGPVVFALADGLAYALDGANGGPLWQLPVGLSAPFAPRPVPGGGTALVVDARSDELLHVDGRTGQLLWRQPLDEPVKAPPLVLGPQVIQPTPSGKLLLIELATGTLRGTLDLGLPLAQTPVADEDGQFFYLLAERSSLFVVRRDPPECVAVEYLGHEPGSIACPPARVGRYLIVAENHALNAGRWTVFLLEQDGAAVRRIQAVPIAGWTWDTPAGSGSVLWSTADRGAVVAYALGPYESKEPLSIIARMTAEERPSGPAFARSRSDREVWVASSRSGRYDLDVERGALSATWSLGRAGPALAPIQSAGRLAVLTQQSSDGPGVALWGIEPYDGSVAWRTTLGAPWPIDPAPSARADALTTLGSDGRTVELTRSKLESGGFVELALPRAAGDALPADPLARLEGAGLSVVVPAAGAAEVVVCAGDGTIKRLALPAPLAALPRFWGDDLLIPSSDGRVYLIDPRNGSARAEPFVPPFDKTRPTRWLRPAPLDNDTMALADDGGRLRRLVRSAGPGVRLEAAGEPVDLGSPIVADPASTGAALLVATADNKLRVLAGRDLSPAGAYPLDAALRLGPVAVADHAFAAVADGRVLAFAPDGRRLWTEPLGDAPPIGPPVLVDGVAWFLGRDGLLQARALDDGRALDRIPLEVVPAAGPVAVGPDLALPVARGTLRMRTPKPPTP